MAQEPQPWGGEVHLPGWLRRLLRRPPEEAPSPEFQHAARKEQRAKDQAAFEHMRAAGTVGPHPSELPGGKASERHRGR
jgi:hypothetical protein